MTYREFAKFHSVVIQHLSEFQIRLVISVVNVVVKFDGFPRQAYFRCCFGHSKNLMIIVVMFLSSGRAWLLYKNISVELLENQRSETHIWAI